MPSVELDGDRAMARGAVVAGVRVVTSYPGSPSSGTVGPSALRSAFLTALGGEGLRMVIVRTPGKR